MATLLVAALYVVIALGSVALDRASGDAIHPWRLGAWLASAVLAATQIWYEHYRLASPPAKTAVRAAASVALGAFGLAYIGIALYSVAVLFQLVTLPVEFDASSRAKRQLFDLGLVPSTEAGGVQSVLKAAAWTYVAGALAAVATLLYFLSMLQNR